MTKEQQDILEHIKQVKKSNTLEFRDYWIDYSNINTWQFWLLIGFLLVPLIVLYFLIDKRKAFQIGFFGFSVHVLFTSIDQFGVLHGLWEYPYLAVPFSPTNVVLDAVLLPISSMLVYQWAVNHQKNHYLYLILLGIVTAFIFKPIMSWLNLIKMHEWMNYAYFFCACLIVMFISIWITNFFLYLQKSANEQRNFK